MKKTEKELLQKYTKFLRQNSYLTGSPKNVIKGYVGEFLEVHTLNPEPGKSTPGSNPVSFFDFFFTDKEELRNIINDSLFGFKDEEYGFTQAETAILIKVEKLLEAKDKECAAKIAAGERLRMEDAMSAINEANGLREKIKEQELIIYGIEEGAEQWKSLCADKDKEINELREYKRLNIIGLSGYTPEELHEQITDLKAEIERLKGENDILEKTLSGSLKLAEAQAKQLTK